MRALVFAHHREGLLGDRAHLLDVELLLQVEHRPHMQAADRGVRVPGAVGAVLARRPAVSRSVYSARSSSGTAQSSMKETGFPSPFIDIMMLRPCLAHVPHRAAGRPGRSPRRRAPGKPRSPISSTSCLEAPQVVGRRRRRRTRSSSIAVGLALHEAVDDRRGTSGCRATARSSCGRPARPRSGPSLTMCWVASIAL